MLNGFFGLLSIIMAFAQPIAGMIGLLLYGGAFTVLVRDRPSQWRTIIAEQEDAAEQEETPVTPVTVVQHTAPPHAPLQAKSAMASTYQAKPKPMTKCPSCGYPNRHGRTICFKCQTPLPTPTSMQRLGSWVLSWNALCFALIVVVALLIHAIIVSKAPTVGTPLDMGSTAQTPIQQQPQPQQQQPVQAQEPDQAATLSDSQARDGLIAYASKQLAAMYVWPSEFDEITSISVSACDTASGYDYSGRVGFTVTEEKPDDPKDYFGPKHQEIRKKHADSLRHKVGAPADQWEGL